MNRKFFFFAGVLSLLFVLGFQSTAMADDWDHKTIFTINQPVLVPGHVVLPAGTYVIKRLDAVTPVVQILNESETKVYATVLPVPEFVVDPPDKPAFTFQEMPEGTAMALKSWIYPGSQTAYEFLPSKNSGKNTD
jgi:hypothetical protein